MSLPLYQVDAFTTRPFSGNPAGVCLLSDPVSDQWMANVAKEMNLSETAFLLRQGDSYGLRWFTPEVEVALCGHATLASAHTLWESGRISKTEVIRFYTLSGLLTAKLIGDWIQLDFPATPVEPCSELPGIEEALKVPAKFVGKSSFDYFIEVESEETVRNLNPDFSLLKGLPARGVIVTAASSSPDHDFVSRFFAPAVGINEDPVTGSAHACLTPFWINRLEKPDLVAYQASARGGLLHLSMQNDRVLISGQAVTVFKAELLAV